MIARSYCTILIGAFSTAALVLAGCSPLAVHSFAEPESALRRHHTYAWADDVARTTGDPRLDSNPFFERRLISDVDRELKARGFAQVEMASADLTLHYHVNVTRQLDVTTVDRGYGYCVGCKSDSLYDRGTILLDLVNAKTTTLVWRAWAEGVLDNIIDNQQWLNERIDQSVVKIIATLPRRP